jgi:ureidoacrylate peracid hydrolase
LDFILRSRGIKTLAVAGFLTNCCVESTARTGYERGFNIVALSDCAATLSDEEQQFTFKKNLPMFARILTHKEFLADLASK